MKSRIPVAYIGEFDAAVRWIAAGGTALDPEVVCQLMGSRRGADTLDRLTSQEHEVLALMAEGHSNSPLAEHLSISERAVEKHIGIIFTKLDLPPSAAYHRRVLASGDVPRARKLAVTPSQPPQ